MGEQKYEKLVYHFQPEYHANTIDGKDIHDGTPQAYFRGACQIPGSQFNIGYGLVTAPCLAAPYPHKHLAEEYLIFGSESTEAKDWDAEVELIIGLGDDAETYIIDRPAAVRIPAGVWHCPMNFKRVGRPVFFQSALLQGMFGGFFFLPDGEKAMYYNGQIQCVLNPQVKCVACGRCLVADWRKSE